MRVKPIHAALAAALCAALVQPAQAQHRDHGAYHGSGSRPELAWRGGHWVHTYHGNRFAWWWVTGSDWYFYPAPVYPYPAYAPPPTAQPPVGYWYYCDNPPGYYPYVPSCNVPWRPMPAR